MRKTITLSILIMIFLTGCTKSFVQIFETKTTNPNFDVSENVFENEFVKITYSFWASNGIMSFSVYNKLDKPIYIDWKSSSFVFNDHKLDYWMDEMKTTQVGYYQEYYYYGPLFTPFSFIDEGVQVSKSNSVKPERITFVPPKSFTSKSQFYLFPDKIYKFGENKKKTYEKRNDNPKKKTIVFTDTFNYSDSPLRFRNYLAISFEENSQKFQFIDNEFYLSSVKEMDFLHFRGKLINAKQIGSYYERPYRKRNSFFIQLEWRTVTK